MSILKSQYQMNSIIFDILLEFTSCEDDQFKINYELENNTDNAANSNNAANSDDDENSNNATNSDDDENSDNAANSGYNIDNYIDYYCNRLDNDSSKIIIESTYINSDIIEKNYSYHLKNILKEKLTSLRLYGYTQHELNILIFDVLSNFSADSIYIREETYDIDLANHINTYFIDYGENYENDEDDEYDETDKDNETEKLKEFLISTLIKNKYLSN